MRKIVSVSWSWQEIKIKEPDEFMSAYISTYYEKRLMNTWVHSGFSGYIWLDTKIVFQKIKK